MSVYTTALSGLLAQAKAVGAYAQNIANQDVTGTPNPGPGDRVAYAPVDPVFVNVAGGGVTEQNVPVEPASVNVYNPDSADADSNGLVAVPNEDLDDQIVGMIFAKNAYAANAKIIKAQDEMDQDLLNILT